MRVGMAAPAPPSRGRRQAGRPIPTAGAAGPFPLRRRRSHPPPVRAQHRRTVDPVGSPGARRRRARHRAGTWPPDQTRPGDGISCPADQVGGPGETSRARPPTACSPPRPIAGSSATRASASEVERLDERCGFARIAGPSTSLTFESVADSIEAGRDDLRQGSRRRQPAPLQRPRSGRGTVDTGGRTGRRGRHCRRPGKSDGLRRDGRRRRLLRPIIVPGCDSRPAPTPPTPRSSEAPGPTPRGSRSKARD